MSKLDALTTPSLKKFPDVGYNIERTYTFRDRFHPSNSVGYLDTVYRSEFPLLEAKITGLFFNDGCNRIDFDSFMLEMKSKRSTFLFKDDLNCIMRPSTNLTVESHTVSKQWGSINTYRLFQVYKYGTYRIEKPLLFYEVDSVKINGVNVTYSHNLSSPLIEIANTGNHQINGIFYTPVKIREGKETENIQKKLRSVNELSLYENPIEYITNV